MTSSAFALPPRLSAKADPSLVDADSAHLARVAAAVARQVGQLEERLEAELRKPGGGGQATVERDLEVHRLSARLRTLRRYGRDLCLGRIVTTDGERTYVGRLGVTAEDGTRLLVDWRSPAAERFFAATAARPMGVASRRRYRWSGGRIVDYWDEPLSGTAAVATTLDEDSALMASLGASRSSRMRDVLSTIQADQDSIIRASSAGALVVDGGPGTGKTVVALHRAAYLTYADARLAAQGGGVLVVGPHRPYLAYIADVLPSLGEDSVRTCTVTDLVPEGRLAPAEADPDVARLKADLDLAIDAAVALYEEPPTSTLRLDVGDEQVEVTPADWVEAFAAPEPGTAHNDARDAVWTALLTIVVDRVRSGSGDDEAREDPDEFDAYGLDQGDPDAAARTALSRNRALLDAIGAAWPILEPTELVGDLYEVPAYLRRCAPWLSVDEAAALRRDRPDAWTVADLPILDAARHRLGDPDRARRLRGERLRREAHLARMREVAEDLMAADDTELHVMSMLRGQDLREELVGNVTEDAGAGDRLAGPFAHVVVDEAQELTDAEWRALLRRCPSGSLTVVGDRAQARRGFPEAWEDRLARVGLRDVASARLSVNYRTPAEVMAEAAPAILAALPDANVPESIRVSGIPVRRGARSDRDAILSAWLTAHEEGVACVIGDPSAADGDRVRSLSPEQVKGLEFDLVVVVDPAGFGGGLTGAVDRYVAMTRSTRELVILDG
ncbi:RNA polymerase recycling motor ATPase HelR [Demequina mangrovi]|uniref:DNA helicase IV n=1 Tax=Demequina mangrovi TaxID=1043493 RepID=A0A1H6U2P9_9MICO|nr:RNA polymerase recycling motor ATPase HelR [Demequina mangrovi]SEI82232.1 DNA helicase IV [Demequina mangrovi]